MLRLLQAGLIAACGQLVAVVIVTLSASQFLPDNFIDQSGLIAGSPVFTWAYLLIAIGFALTSNRFVNLTADRFRRASRLIGERRAAKMLAFQFGISAILFGTLALRSPPEFLMDGLHYVGGGSAASTVWAGVMSVCVACFGAIAHSAFKAHRGSFFWPTA